MAECLGVQRFLLLILTLGYVLEEVLSANNRERDVAHNKEVILSSKATGRNASASVDGDLDTCMSTMEEKGPWWIVDLGEEHTITSLTVFSKDFLTYMEVYVGNERNVSGNALCYTYNPGANDKPVSFSCYNPSSGRFVVLYGKFRTELIFCEVKVFECLDGYFSRSCEKRCHCNSSKTCNKHSGKCPPGIGCAPGWKGPACQLECPQYHFGQGCHHRCHCADDRVCHRETGVCPNNTCKEGWIGDTCQTRIPFIYWKPDSGRKSSTSILVKWKAWTEPRDPGIDIVYDLYYKKHALHGESRWLLWQDNIPQPNLLPYSNAKVQVEVMNLTYGTYYMFRVQPVLTNGKKKKVPTATLR